MANDLVEPDWPAITEAETVDILAHYPGAGARADPVTVTWRSPRPMSAAALVAVGDATYFLKRHHVRVRSTERLALEHDFARHLRTRGLSTPAILATRDGSTVVERDQFVYELHECALGEDRYRDVPSWYPFISRADAQAAGAALAHLHRAAADFLAAAWDFGPLVDAASVILAADPADAYRRLVTTRPGLATATRAYDVAGDFDSFLRRPIESAAARLGNVSTQWTHGDWHGSNLTWRGPAKHASVASVLDLGLANRTFTLHDLAVAIERSVVDWLDLAGVGSVSVDYGSLGALLAGYTSVAPLSDDDLATLAAVLPVAHVEFALSEVEYFGSIVDSPANVELAYRSYLLGHARWFDSPEGASLLAHVRAGTAPAR